MIICKHCFISGRVQGVVFRASAARRAIELKVTGYAKNLPDGRVEVLACGEPVAVDALCNWLRQGPPAARVSDVVIREVECTDVPRVFAIN
ncbi:MAG TPA: acylphosphatase [Gammaproteobacteria bacterium]|nr:acylphosphatase [Gammaproteobacteria bacterium]